jgi:hypothetical protein
LNRVFLGIGPRKQNNFTDLTSRHSWEILPRGSSAPPRLHEFEVMAMASRCPKFLRCLWSGDA